jgi:hypothetical protein
MPHSAVRLVSALNGVTNDPVFLIEHKEAIDGATSATELVQALGLPADLLPIAADVDAFLPPAVVEAALGAYRGAAAAGTDVVVATWRRSAGFSVAVGHERGSHPQTAMGAVSVHVASPPLSAEG